MSSALQSPLKSVIQLSLPMALSRFLQMFSGFISTMMVSHLGKMVLASCALIGATLTPILLVFMAIVFSLSFIAGQYYGAKKYVEIGALVQQGIIISVFLGLLMMLCFWYADKMLLLFHQDPAKLVYVKQYFHVLFWGAIAILAQSCMEQFFYAILKQKIVIMINFISVLIGIPMAYAFIFGYGIIPALGVKGLALTFVIQAWGCFLTLVFCAYLKKEFKIFQLFYKHSLKNCRHMKQIVSLGWPMSVQFGGELGAFFAMTMMIGWLGTNALAATQVVQQWMYLVIVPIFAMAEASGILVGQAVGAKAFHQLNAIARASLWLSIVLVLSVDLAFIVFPHYFASFYLSAIDATNKGILQLIPPLFALLAITLVFNAIRDVMTGSLRGLFDTRFPMIVGLAVMWFLVLPLGYYFAFTLHFNVIGFRIGSNIGLLIGALIIIWRWRVKVAEYQ